MAEVNELVRFQRELKEEEQLIVSMLSKIDTQLHALQVEQLQLLNATNRASAESSVGKDAETTKSAITESNVKQELDLVVRPVSWQESENEDSD